MKQNLNNVVVIILMLFAGDLVAQEEQQQVSSLLSNVGLGTTLSEATVAEKAQGDLSVVSNNNSEVLSFTNPALLSDLQLTTFGLSLQSLSAKVKTTDSNFKSGAVSVSNVSFGVPLGLKGGFAAGVRTHSAVGYEVDTNDFYNKGRGGVNQIYVGIGYEVYKGLSLGIQGNIFFGQTTKKQVFRGVQKATVYDEVYNTTGIAAKIGAQYKFILTEKIQANIGAYGIINNKIKASGNSNFYEAIESDKNSFSQISTPVSTSLSGAQKNPFKSVFGAGLGTANYWFAGISLETQGAVSYTGNVFNKGLSSSVSFKSSSKLSLGGYIIPKKYALKNYLNRVVYRAGLKYQNTGIVLNNETIKNIGMSFGVGLPVGKRVSYANITLELGKLGNFSKNKYQENYINVGVNFTLSDKWFNKRVID